MLSVERNPVHRPAWTTPQNVSRADVVEQPYDENPPFEGDLQNLPSFRGATEEASSAHQAEQNGVIEIHQQFLLQSGRSSPVGDFMTKIQEAKQLPDPADATHKEFAELLKSSLQGSISYLELVARCEACCREISDIVRDEAAGRTRATEWHTLRQKSFILQSEAATWALLCHLLRPGEGRIAMEGLLQKPPPSEQQACEFVEEEEQPQLCLRVVQWLEAMASHRLDRDKQKRGGHVGVYLQQDGVRKHTIRALKEEGLNGSLVRRVDPDAPTREGGHLHPEDERVEEGLLEDIWQLLKAGRLAEARQLCRTAGQPWRAASLGGCGDSGPTPSVADLKQSGRGRESQAVEMEAGNHGRQRRLWKWAAFSVSQRTAESGRRGKCEAAIYGALCSNIRQMLPMCPDWESACWALVRAWLDCQVDAHLALMHSQESDNQVPASAAGGSLSADVDAAMNASCPIDGWPQPVEDQQPGSFQELLQWLQSSPLVHEEVRRSSKEQHRQLQMGLILLDIAHLLDLLRAWIAPSGTPGAAGPSCSPQLMRCGAVLVVLLRKAFPREGTELHWQRLSYTGDLILNTYAIQLFTQRQEDLVAVYACQMAPYLREELYANMMDLRENDSKQVKERLMGAALQQLPFHGEGSVLSILQRVLVGSRARIASAQQGHAKSEPRDELLRKARAVDWLCLPLPPGLPAGYRVKAELCARALLHSTLLLRDFALGGLVRSPKVPAEAHHVLAEVGAMLEDLGGAAWPRDLTLSMADVSRCQREFQCWREYFTCDQLYRNWLEADQANSKVPVGSLSVEERNLALQLAHKGSEAALTLLQSEGATWLGLDESLEGEHQQMEPSWLLLEATAALRKANGGYLLPDAAACTALRSALLACARKEEASLRHLSVEVKMHPHSEGHVLVKLRCQLEGPVSADFDGGLLTSIMALAVKGEMPGIQRGSALLVTSVDAWLGAGNIDQAVRASTLIRALCRQCCVPELALRCLQMRVDLASAGQQLAINGTEVTTVVAASLHSLFTPPQLQDVLRLEREIILCSMEQTDTLQDEMHSESEG